MAELDVTAKMCEDLYNIMIKKFFAEDYDGADEMASSLLLKADLPLIYRIWCHMILGSAGAGAVCLPFPLISSPFAASSSNTYRPMPTSRTPTS